MLELNHILRGEDLLSGSSGPTLPPTSSNPHVVFDLRGGGPDDCWDDVVAAWDVSDLSLAVDRLEALAASDDPFFLALGSSDRAQVATLEAVWNNSSR